MNIFFQGMPTAGKGTQAKMLAAYFPEMLMVDMGSMLRNAQIEPQLLAAGQLLDSKIVHRVLLDFLGDRRNNLIFDGLPRRAEDLFLPALGLHVDLVFQLVMTIDEARHRLQGRRIHLTSGRTYNIYTRAPLVPEIDDVTGEPLSIRADDVQATLERRVQDYNAFWPTFHAFVADAKNHDPRRPLPQWHVLPGQLDIQQLHQHILQHVQAYRPLLAAIDAS